MTFSPVATFSGHQPAGGVRVKDSNRNSARATITVTVLPVRPVTVDDSAKTAFGTAVVVNVLGNDKPGDPSAPLVPASVVLRDPADGKDKKAVTVPDEGAFTVGADGAITFTPAKGFIGTTRTLAYRVTDANGTSDTALLEVTVAGPLLAKATPDTATGTPGNAVAVNPLLNDSGAIDPSTVCLRTGTGHLRQAGHRRLRALAVAPDGTITLTPTATFTGTAKVTYERTEQPAPPRRSDSPSAPSRPRTSAQSTKPSSHPPAAPQRSSSP